MKAAVLPALPVYLLTALAVVPARADGPGATSAGVVVVRNVAYCQGDGADPVCHRLDLYLPRGRQRFPVVFFVHGGAWTRGDKNQFGIYGRLGRCLARQGIGMVSINYRLSPAVRHPGHVKDVARAFAWTYKNIARYGGRPDELFVAGHSAGGHLVALLATDERYLRAEGLTLKAVRGAIPISGLYTLPDYPTVRRVFGKDRAVLRDASPVNHVGPRCPPFLIVYSEHELPGCEGGQAEAFCKALSEHSCPAQTFRAAHRNHISVLVDAGYDGDPVLCRMLGFVAAQVTLHRLAAGGAGGVDFLTELLARSAHEEAPTSTGTAGGPTRPGFSR
jgi:acetyl esterase/lipase